MFICKYNVCCSSIVSDDDHNYDDDFMIGWPCGCGGG